MTDAPLESSYGVGACCAGRHQFFILAPSPYHRAWRHSASLMSLERLAKNTLRAAGSQRRFDVAGKARRAAEIDALKSPCSLRKLAHNAMQLKTTEEL